MGYLGDRGWGLVPVVSNDDTNPFGNGFWSVHFTPEVFSFNTTVFEVYHIYLSGPAGSTFVLYKNARPYSTASRGDANEWDPNQPLPMVGGASLTFFWDSAATPKPIVIVSCRTPTSPF